MYHVEINQERFRNHIQYDWWKYIAGILATVFLWSLMTAITRPRTPDDKKLDIFLVGDYVLDEPIETISNNILQDFPNLLEVNIDSIPIGGDSGMDYAGRQKLMVMMGSQTGDIYVFDKVEFEKFAIQGAFLPLDDFIEQNKDLIDLDNLEKHKREIREGEEESEAHYYGVPMDAVKIFDNTGYNSADKVLGITAFSRNQSSAFDVLKWILNNGSN